MSGSVSARKGSLLTDVAPSPAVIQGIGQRGIITAYNGATVLQSRGEYLKIADGGHTDYYGNEIYALNLRTATPGWQRIWGPTPNAQILTSNPVGNWPAYLVHGDNTPRPCHGWFNRVATDGPDGEHLWTLESNANPSGITSLDCWSIPRASCTGTSIRPRGSITAGTTRLPQPLRVSFWLSHAPAYSTARAMRLCSRPRRMSDRPAPARME